MCIIFQTLAAKCESLTRGVSHLEEKCIDLSSTVDDLKGQLDRSEENEEELRQRVAQLARATSEAGIGISLDSI